VSRPSYNRVYKAEERIVNGSANVQVIRQLYDAMARSDIERVLELLSEDVTFVVPGPPGVGAAGIWRGHDGVQACLRKLRADQENQSVEIVEFVAERDKVVVLLHVKAKSLGTGKTFESDIIHYFTIKDGQIVSLLDFFDTAALVEAHRA
jgi:ketosteroid isomerase-like protein